MKIDDAGAALAAATVCTLAALAIFGTASACVFFTHALPTIMGPLWIFAGLLAAVGAVPCAISGLVLTWRGRWMLGLSAIVAAAAAPCWFFYGVLAVTEP